MKTETSTDAFAQLRAAIREEYRQEIMERLNGLASPPAAKAKRAYRITSAGRARLIAAMKRYWANRRRSK